MSKLLKSKFLLGVVVIAIMFVGVVAVSAKTASADCSITSTLRMGSTGAQVVCLQTALGGLTADGNFGPKTAAAVKAWQTKEGLTADGVFGPKSNAVWVSNAGNSANFPAGCTSNVGFSSTTGGSCAVSSTLPAGCTSTTGYSPTTGMLCSVTSNLPAGCSSTVGYNPTTGAACNGTATPAGPLVGGAGNISDVNKLSVYNDEVLNEGESGNILSFEVKADNGSDLNLSSLKLTFTHAGNGGSGSYRLDRYIGDVSVYMGSTKVGTASVADFSKDSSNVYSKTIALSGVTVKAGQKVTLVVGVTANTTIDSTDQHSGGLDWTVAYDSMRYNDATGAILTDSTNGISELVGFSSIVNSGDLELKLSEASTNPITENVAVSETSTTKNVPLLAFNLEAKGGSMDISRLELVATETGDSAGIVTMVNGFDLYQSGVTDPIASADTGLSDGWDEASNASGKVVFSDLNITIPADATTTFTVKATMKKVATTSNAAVYDEGDSLTLGFTNATLKDVSLTIAETTTGGNTVLTGDRTGSVAGNKQTFSSQGLSAQLVSSSIANVSRTDGALQSADVIMNVAVTAVGNDYFIPRVVAVGTTGINAPTLANLATDMGTTVGFDVRPLTSAYAFAATTQGVAGTTGSVAIVSGATLVTQTGGSVGLIKIADGTTAVLQITMTINKVGASAASGAIEMQLNGVAGSADQSLGTAITPFTTLPAVSFQSIPTPAF